MHSVPCRTPHRSAAVATILVSLVAPWPSLAAGGRLSGSGTDASPFLVEDYTDLESIPDSGLGKVYRLVADIDASASLHEHGDSGFVPVGSSLEPFSGTFHGASHVIRDLFIIRPGRDQIGLFGHVSSSGRVDSVTLSDATVSGGYAVGAIAGSSEGVVESCRSSGSILGRVTVGGIVGASYGPLRRSNSSASIGSTEGSAGGVVGAHYVDTILDCHATGAVAGGSSVGGLVGFNAGQVVHGSATGPISGKEQLGGLAGQNYLKGGIQRSWASGKVVGTGMYVGGLVGYIDYDGLISDCYATGSATGDGDVGGLVGYSESGRLLRCYATGRVTSNGFGDGDGALLGYGSEADATIADCRWNSDSTSLPGAGRFAGTTTATTPLSTTQMLHAASFAKWDVSASGPWSIDEGDSPPVLRPAPSSGGGTVGVAPAHATPGRARVLLRGGACEFPLAHPASVVVSIHAIDGSLLARTSLGAFPAGTHSVPLPAVPARTDLVAITLELDGAPVATIRALRP